MITGTLFIYVYGELLEPKSIELLESSMFQHFTSVSDNIEFDYRRFAFYAARMKWTVPLKIFWKNDTIYKSLKKYVDKYFTNWGIDIVLLLTEKGE